MLCQWEEYLLKRGLSKDKMIFWNCISILRCFVIFPCFVLFFSSELLWMPVFSPSMVVPMKSWKNLLPETLSVTSRADARYFAESCRILFYISIWHKIRHQNVSKIKVLYHLLNLKEVTLRAHVSNNRVLTWRIFNI